MIVLAWIVAIIAGLTAANMYFNPSGRPRKSLPGDGRYRIHVVEKTPTDWVYVVLKRANSDMAIYHLIEPTVVTLKDELTWEDMPERVTIETTVSTGGDFIAISRGW